MKKIELLAPAKNLQCGLAAINCGADAVYIGAPKFGARSKAGNSMDDIATLVRHAHIYWANVYVTLNTLLYDHEIPEAVSIIHQLYQIGVDGLIIQDTGLLACDLPPIPLIASTQMHNNSPDKVHFLEQMGFLRTVLARELTIDQIREIHQQTNIELECFIHGALCVCFSGQCYLSYAIGGRSGNRGECAQPCRKRYRIVNKKGEEIQPMKHWLSISDLNLSEHLTDLINAGVNSFKIEGRLKEKAYVTNIVAYYRQKLDLILADKHLDSSSSGRTELDFDPDPSKTFNRNYTTYFINGRQKSPGVPDTPKMVGELIGKVKRTDGSSFSINGNIELNNGDGICFYRENGELMGTLVNTVKKGVIKPASLKGIRTGLLIYRNSDHTFLKRLENTRTQRKISITFKVSETEKGIQLAASDEDGNTVQVDHEFDKFAARDADKMKSKLEKSLNRSGDTPFRVDQIDIHWPTIWFVPISLINELRRHLLDELLVLRIKNHPSLQKGTLIPNSQHPEPLLDYRGNVLNQAARNLYTRHGVTQIDPCPESGIDLKGKQVMVTKYCIKHQLGLCKGSNSKQRLDEPWFLEDEQRHKFELKFDCSKCEMALIWKK